MGTDNREQITFRMEPTTKEKITNSLGASNCRNQNEFIEKAVIEYADRLAMGNNPTLPLAIQVALDGRLSLLEKNLQKVSFRYAVLLDMLTFIIGNGFEYSQDELRKLHAASIKRVKQTKGEISLYSRAGESWEDDDEWQS